LAKIIYTRRALADLEQLADFLAEADLPAATKTLDLITEAIILLEHHPYIGSVADDELRELVISRGKSGYVALYSYEEDDDIILILAIRHQREVGYLNFSGSGLDK